MDGRSSKRAAKTIEIHLFSDSTGDTAARVARAAQTQFSGHPTVLVRHPRVTTLDGLEAAYEPPGRTLARRGPLHDRRPRAAPRPVGDVRARRHRLLRPPRAAARGARPGCRARGRPGVRAADRARRRLLPARRRDGVRRSSTTTASRARGSTEAEIVLVGVSRTGKTPLSMYLGYLGYKTANVPLVRGIEPPAHLFAIEAARVVGLTIDAERLARIRGRRLRALGGSLARRLRRARADHGGARRGDGRPAPARLSGARRHEPRRRGGRAACRRARRPRWSSRSD